MCEDALELEGRRIGISDKRLKVFQGCVGSLPSSTERRFFIEATARDVSFTADPTKLVDLVARGEAKTAAALTLLPAMRNRQAKPRNPLHFDGIEGWRNVSDTLLTKTVFDTLRGAQPLSHALFGVKTLSGTLMGLAFTEKGLRG